MSTGKCLSLSSSCSSLIDSGNLCDRDDHLNCAHFILWTSQVSLFSTYSAGDTVAKFICGCFPLNLYFLWSHPFLSLPRGCILSRNVSRKCLSRKKLLFPPRPLYFCRPQPHTLLQSSNSSLLLLFFKVAVHRDASVILWWRCSDARKLKCYLQSFKPCIKHTARRPESAL